MIETRTAEGEGDYLEMVDGFAEFIDGEVDSAQRSAGPTDEALVGAIASIVAYHLRSERLDRLEEPVPELVCLALLPYLGFDGAKGWADTDGSGLRKHGAVCGCPAELAGNRDNSRFSP